MWGLWIVPCLHFIAVTNIEKWQALGGVTSVFQRASLNIAEKWLTFLLRT
jgi:hypothetical protein